MTINFLVIGGGFAGCSAAHQLEKVKNSSVTLIEAAPFLGAGNKTHFYGGHPYTFGPRHFLTRNEKIYDYLNSIVPLRSCADHEFISYVERDNAFYAYPINMDDVKKMPDYENIKDEMKINESKNFIKAKNATNLEDYWIGSVGSTLFDKFINEYNKKMWLVDSCKEIDTFGGSPKGVTLKEGPKAAWDDSISAYPYDINGYDSYFPFATKNTNVLLSTKIDEFDLEKKSVKINGEILKFDFIISTISPDILFQSCYGELKFIGRDLHKIVFPTEFVFPENVYFQYYTNDEKFTRMVEYKKFTKHVSPTTLIGLEIPSNNGKHYPLPFKSEQKKASKYFSDMPDGIFSLGRAGSYLYGIDIDDCIWQSMLLVDNILQGGQDHPVPGEEYRFPEL